MERLDLTISKKVDITQLDFTSEEVKEAVAALLYHNDNIALPDALKLTRKTRRDFETQILPRFGFTTMDGIDVEEELSGFNAS